MSPFQRWWADFNEGENMLGLKKCALFLSTSLMLGCTTVAPSTESDMKLAEPENTLRLAAASYEKALPALVSAGHYRSAGNVALLLASARSRLHQSAGTCAALSQSQEYFRKAVMDETDRPEYESGVGINDQNGEMTRERIRCARPASSSHHRAEIR
jgi:hypothetical protein